jgi:hypothetical protein
MAKKIATKDNFMDIIINLHSNYFFLFEKIAILKSNNKITRLLMEQTEKL